MKTLFKLHDNEFPFNGVKEIRQICRGFIYNDKKEICFICLYGDDIFGHRDYLETPGGGKDSSETLIEGLKREIQEEIGYTIKNIKPLGRVTDYYNLIKRKNDNHYFLAEADQFIGTKREEFEIKMFKDVVWLSVDNAISLYKEKAITPIARLVANRELPLLQIVKEELSKLEN